jgi:hypothetical protein
LKGDLNHGNKENHQKADAIVDREIAKATLAELSKGDKVPEFINP